jgi:hypothetical protein
LLAIGVGTAVGQRKGAIPGPTGKYYLKVLQGEQEMDCMRRRGGDPGGARGQAWRGGLADHATLAARQRWLQAERRLTLPVPGSSRFKIDCGSTGNEA